MIPFWIDRDARNYCFCEPGKEIAVVYFGSFAGWRRVAGEAHIETAKAIIHIASNSIFWAAFLIGYGIKAFISPFKSGSFTHYALDFALFMTVAFIIIIIAEFWISMVVGHLPKVAAGKFFGRPWSTLPPEIAEAWAVVPNSKKKGTAL